MEHRDKVKAIQFIRPNAKFILTGDEIEWLDTEQTEPTIKEIEQGLIAYKKAVQTEAEAKAVKRAELLNRLGLTEEEARILLG